MEEVVADPVVPDKKPFWKRIWKGKFDLKKAGLVTTVFVIVLATALAIWRFGFKVRQEAGQTGSGISFKLSSLVAPKLVPSPLSGEMVSEADASRHPLGVMIEDHPDARPQSGLEKASIVYEAETEGGITRFLAIFGPNGGGDTEVGPIRSARSFFVDWIEEYNGYYTHAGEALDAGQKMRAEGVMELSGYTDGTRKTYNGNVGSEHTLYNTLSNLYSQANKLGFSKTATFEQLKFKVDTVTADLGNQSVIKINYGDVYNVAWSYDKTKNIYSRSLAGAPHIPRHTTTPLTAKNIIIQEVSRTPLALPGAKPTFKFQTIGVGKAKVVLDGKTIEATWKKEGMGKRTKFYDISNNEIQFDRGVTWYEIIPPGEVGVDISTN